MAGSRSVELIMQTLMPHTLNALQKLVMAMASVQNNAGKKTFFGRDKGQESYAKFLLNLKATIHAMILDNLIRESTSSTDVVATLVGKIQMFSEAFPNWQDAYMFSAYFFEAQESDAVAAVERLRSTP